jgi:hypothetical protein
LVSRLQRLGLDGLDEPLEHALLPLVFEKGIYLDGFQLSQRVASLMPRLPEGFEFGADQFIVAPDDRYKESRHRFIDRKEHVEDDSYYSPELSRGLSERYDFLLKLERRLIEGVQLIVNGIAHMTSPLYDVGVACHWFARDIRSQTLALLYQSQNPDREDRIDFGKDCESLPFMTDSSAAKFLEIERTFVIDVGPGHAANDSLAVLDNSVPISIDDNSSSAQLVRDALICSMHFAHDWELYSKYVVPQMVSRHLANPTYPLTLTFDDWYVGIH